MINGFACVAYRWKVSCERSESAVDDGSRAAVRIIAGRNDEFGEGALAASMLGGGTCHYEGDRQNGPLHHLSLIGSILSPPRRLIMSVERRETERRAGCSAAGMNQFLPEVLQS